MTADCEAVQMRDVQDDHDDEAISASVIPLTPGTHELRLVFHRCSGRVGALPDPSSCRASARGGGGQAFDVSPATEFAGKLTRAEMSRQVDCQRNILTALCIGHTETFLVFCAWPFGTKRSEGVTYEIRRCCIAPDTDDGVIDGRSRAEHRRHVDW